MTNDEREEEEEEEETLETFTLITTAACQPLKWLHHRQPVFIWDMHLAREWILNPSQELMDKIATLASDYGRGMGSMDINDTTPMPTSSTSMYTSSVDGKGTHDDAISTSSSSNNYCLLAWHPVSKRMSNISYQEADCMDEIKVEQVASIKSFFGANAKNSNIGKIRKGDSQKSTCASRVVKKMKLENQGSVSSSSKKKMSPKKGSIANFFAPKKS